MSAPTPDVSRKGQAAGKRCILLVNLWIKGDVAGFEAYEKKASRLLSNHGGRIERAIRIQPHTSAGAQSGAPGTQLSLPASTPQSAEAPFEVHLISFPDRSRYLAYRADPEVRALVDERNRVIEKTVVWEGVDTAELE